MKTLARMGAVAAVAVLALTLAACHGSSNTTGSAKASAAASAIAANPQAQQAKQIVQTCLTQQGPHLHALIQCIEPTGHKAALENCLGRTFADDGLLATKADRAKWEQTDAPECVVNNR